MKLHASFLQLPIRFDAALLAAEIGRLGEEAWRPHPQGYAGNSAIPLVACRGESGSDAVSGPMAATPELLACPYLQQVLAAIGGVWGRSRLMRLSGQGEVVPHVDIDYYWREHIRVHVPVVTQPDVTFQCGDQALHMAAGECWVFDTWKTHRVVNSADRSRIHIVADTVGGPGFWNLMSQARIPGRSAPGWRPAMLGFDPATHPSLRFESTNVPVVMTPWEVKEHLGFIVGDARPHPNLPMVNQLIGHFIRHWRSLWALHGESPAGWQEYRDAASAFGMELTRAAEGILLMNGTRLTLAAQRLVLDVAVNDPALGVQADERLGPVPG